MALVPDQKFSTFQIGGTPTTGDIIVGLRGGINTKFNWALPAGVDAITGTANQVLVNGSSGVPVTGNVTLSTPQDIATTSVPTFADLTLTGGIIFDVNNNIGFAMGATVNAVNYIAAINNITGQDPLLTAAGSDPNIDLAIASKGTGSVVSLSANTIAPFQFFSGTNVQHRTLFAMADTSATRTATWQDSDGTVAWLSDVAGTVTSLTGTANQVLVNGTAGSPQTGALTVTLPQDIAITSSPHFNNIRLDGGQILDSNGNIILNFIPALVPVNYASISNNITGNPVILQALGSDTNIAFAFGTKGDAGFGFNTEAVSANPIQIRSGTSGQHVTNLLFANTAATRNITFPDASGTLSLVDGSGGLKSFQIFTSGTAATYTKPSNVTSILVEIVGGGGGGGGITAGATTIAVSGGGGGGGYCRHYIASAAGTYTYTVGGGGAGGVGANPGATGTATTFSTLTANGGTGGSVGNAVAAGAAFMAPGGTGGTATGGNVANIQGSSGQAGIIALTSTKAGEGGQSYFAGATPSQTATTANGVAGQLYGGGGGGALGGLSGGTTQNGGAGEAGIIIVWEFA